MMSTWTTAAPPTYSVPSTMRASTSPFSVVSVIGPALTAFTASAARSLPANDVLLQHITQTRRRQELFGGQSVFGQKRRDPLVARREDGPRPRRLERVQNFGHRHHRGDERRESRIFDRDVNDGALAVHRRRRGRGRGVVGRRRRRRRRGVRRRVPRHVLSKTGWRHRRERQRAHERPGDRFRRHRRRCRCRRRRSRRRRKVTSARRPRRRDDARKRQPRNAG